MNQRRFARLRDLADTRFDLVVAGGGIQGAWTALDATLRGLRVALIERGDWGCGTSSASSKLIHGGLRYLEHGHIGVVRASLAERSRLLRNHPHAIRPLRFLLPLWADARRPAWQVRLGLTAYDALAGSDPGLPGHARITDLPAVFAPGVGRAFAYGDAAEDDARFVWELVRAARMHGVVAINHAAAIQAAAHEVVVEADGQRLAVRCRQVVAACGAWTPRLLGLPANGGQRIRCTQGIHLVLPAMPFPDAVTLTHPRDGRVFFAIPWLGRTLVGTTDLDRDGPDAVAVTAAETDYLLEGITARLPGLGWTAADVVGSFAGLRVLRGSSAAHPSDASREWSLEQPLPGVWWPVGGKYTSARLEAARTVDAVCAGLAHPARCATVGFRLVGADWTVRRLGLIAQAQVAGCDALTASTLVDRHGERSASIVGGLDRADCARVDPAVPICLGDVRACLDEDVVDPMDLLRRRTPLAILSAQDLTPLARMVQGG